jgi:hypothetical protein
MLRHARTTGSCRRSFLAGRMLVAHEQLNSRVTRRDHGVCRFQPGALRLSACAREGACDKARQRYLQKPAGYRSPPGTFLFLRLLGGGPRSSSLSADRILRMLGPIAGSVKGIARADAGSRAVFRQRDAARRPGLQARRQAFHDRAA